MKDIKNKNPWLGLETYKEGQILYGRDSDIRSLTQSVLNNTETLLYGKSGIGKSSILNAGILPAMRRNGYLPVKIQLFHKEDSGSYLQQINRAIIDAILNYQEEVTDIEDKSPSEISDTEYNTADIGTLIREVVPCKNSETESIYEYFHRHTFHNVKGERVKLLIIFDQFEEIFTLQEDVQKRKIFFSQWADMLNDIMPHELQYQEETISEPRDKIKVETEEDFKNILGKIKINFQTNIPDYVTDNEIHFVFTIREDFLSEFEYYSAQIPSLKHNRYGLRPLNEEQAFQIILRPVPGLVNEEIAKLIIEKITGKKDFKYDGIPEIEVDAAVLSLYLSRLYEAKSGSFITKELVEHKDSEIISDFYNDAISDKRISSRTIEYLEDRLLNSQDHRDNITVEEAKEAGKVSETELEILCEEKKILRRFYYAGVLRIEYVHDKLCPVIASNKKERIEKRENEERKRRVKYLRRQRGLAYLITFILVGFITYWFLAYQIPINQRYAGVTKEWGRFVGIEELSKEEASYREYHFVLKKKGLKNKVSSMECRDRFGNLCCNHGLHPYILITQREDSLLCDGINEALNSVCKWEFVNDPLDEESIMQERAYDANNNLQYAFNYNKPKPKINSGGDKQQNEQKQEHNKAKDDKKTRIGSYVDEQGLPLDMLKDGYRFVRITYDGNGHDMLVEYFDYEGNPATNPDGAYQTYYEYDDKGQMISMSSLNIYGKRTIDKAGNCGIIHTYNGYRLVEALSVDEFGREVRLSDGHSRTEYRYDNKGRLIEVSFWNKDNSPGYSMKNGNAHKVLVSYEDNTNTVKYQFLDINNEVISIIKKIFDNKGNQLYFHSDDNHKIETVESKFDENGKVICQKEVTVSGTDTVGIFNYEIKNNIETQRFEGSMYNNNYINRTAYDDNKRVVEDVYYELDGETPYEDDYVYHKQVHFYDDNGERLDKDDYLYCETDSVILYSYIDDKVTIVIIKRVDYYPNMNYKRETLYDGSNNITDIQEKWIDFNDEYSYAHSLGLYYLKNRRSNEKNTAVMFLSKYKFPNSTDTEFKFYNLINRESTPCNENGDTTVTSGYILPKIYSGERNKEAVFIECFDNGRKWHGVLLESDQGITYGDDDYHHSNFSWSDVVLYLNLTTMRVQEHSLSELDYGSKYTYNITQDEYDIYQWHYNNYKETEEYDNYFSRYVAYGEVSEDEGYLVEHGYTGYFFILKWCDWNCTQSLKTLVATYGTYEELPKDIILLPFEIEDDKIVCGDDFIHLNDFNGKLGLHVQAERMNSSVYQENVINKYLEYELEK